METQIRDTSKGNNTLWDLPIEYYFLFGNERWT